MKKQIDIEKLLKWAYCEELPKAAARAGRPVAGGSNFYSIVQLAVLGTRVDTSGGTPDHQEARFCDEPHPDAIRIHEAVGTLDDCHVRLPADWNPMPEIGDDGLAAMALKVAKGRLFTFLPGGGANWRRAPSDLVRSNAILGCDRQDFGAVPERVPLRGQNGGELWFRKHSRQMPSLDGTASVFEYELEDGWDQRRGVPKRGAYRKFYLDPDPVPALIARQEYVLWVECLRVLSRQLSGALAGLDAKEPGRPLLPWRRSQRSVQDRAGAILPDVTFFIDRKSKLDIQQPH